MKPTFLRAIAFFLCLGCAFGSIIISRSCDGLEQPAEALTGNQSGFANFDPNGTPAFINSWVDDGKEIRYHDVSVFATKEQCEEIVVMHKGIPVLTLPCGEGEVTVDLFKKGQTWIERDLKSR